MVIRPGTRIWALVAGMPGRSSTARAAASTAVTTRLFPSRPIRTSGASAGGAASPAFRRSRSVDQSGRKSETTRVIASLQLEISTIPAALGVDQFNKPAVAADARNRQASDGIHRHAPACPRCGLPSEIVCVGVPSPAAQRDAEGSRPLGRELKAARGGHRQSGDLADNSAEAAMAKTFLHAGEHHLVVAAFEIDDAIGGEARL